MFRHILVGLDSSEAAFAALNHALRMAGETNAQVTALSVQEYLPAYATAIGGAQAVGLEADAFFAKLHQAAQKSAAALGIRLQTVVAVGHAVETIVRHAREGGYDLVVLGARAQALGGTADRVAEQAPCSVLLVREPRFAVRVHDKMSRDVVIVHLESPLRQVVHLLKTHRLKAVPVVDASDHVKGIITRGDLFERGGVHRYPSPFDVNESSARSLQIPLGKRARDVMTPQPVTILEHALLSEAARQMTERHLKRLPVVDDTGKLTGIVTRLDVLKAVYEAAKSGSNETAQPQLVCRPVRDAVNKAIPTVNAADPAAVVIVEWLGSPHRQLVVVDEQRRVVGLITEKELMPSFGLEPREALLRRVAGSAPDAPRSRGVARDWMNDKVFCVKLDALLGEALQLMVEQHLKRVPVVDAEGRLTGVIDRDAILNVMVKEATE